MSTEVVVHGAALPLTEPARDKFNQAQVDLLFASAPNGTPLQVFHAFLELAARYELDPFAQGEIWLVPMSGRNGGQGRIAVLVGRDGYLKVARRDPAFIDVDADVVYDKDEFRVTRKADGTRTVEHAYGNPAQRGNAVGAYAVLRREGKPDRYFFAPLTQYAKDADKSAWGYRDSMIIKCATSYISRTTYGVAGPIPADEVGAGLALDQATGEMGPVEGENGKIAFPESIAPLIAHAHALDPQTWRPNEVFARLDGTKEAEAEVEAELREWLATNEPEDAEVVEDDGDEAAADPPPAEPEQDSPAGQSLEQVEGTVAGDEARAAIEARWASRKKDDRAWREKVEVLFARHDELDAAADEVDGDQATEILAELDHIEAELDTLGVPRGWQPVAEGQTSLDA